MMDKYLCPCCSEPLLIHIIAHKKIGFCMNCHQEMPLIEQSRQMATVTEPVDVSTINTEQLSRDQVSRGTLQTTAAGIWILDRQTKTAFVNPKMAEILGYIPEEMIGKSLWKFMDERHPAFSAIAHQNHPGDREEKYNLSLRHRLGKSVWVTLSVRPLFDEENQFEGNLCIAIDTSSQKVMEDAIKKQSQREEAMERLTQVIRNSLNLERIFQMAVTELGKIFKVESVQIVQFIAQGKSWLNRAEYRQPTNSILAKIPSNSGKTYTKQVGSELRSVLRSLTLKVPNSQDEATIQDFLQSCPGGWLPIPLYSRSRLWGSLSLVMTDPGYQWQESDLKLIHGFANQLSIAIYQAELYHQLEESNRKLQQLDIIDSLTGLVSRHGFNDYLSRQWQRMMEEQAPLSLILSRVEDWEQYREQQGDNAADQCLRNVAKIIKHTVTHPHGLVARYQQAEFAVLLPSTNARWAVRLVDTIQEQIGQLSQVSIYSQRLLSFGVASSTPAIGSQTQTLTMAAEQALNRGASRFCQCLLSQKD
ncbi:diguanylate cyclase domain-containing protein [Limnospira sp. PMC 917.15]|uniref:sensor domain-containing diguanylate cyclase n=1 Tax=Limnospira sp. PMC 917.15 TaxID=2981106 RepID=UPI0028E0CD2C|nr:diguanylate cyclase [Limnospira sp. PMC 917.15]MDT9235452.1 diguanylate cyclase [Limnospira sp. PMC 917.15]